MLGLAIFELLESDGSVDDGCAANDGTTGKFDDVEVDDDGDADGSEGRAAAASAFLADGADPDILRDAARRDGCLTATRPTERPVAMMATMAL